MMDGLSHGEESAPMVAGMRATTRQDSKREITLLSLSTECYHNNRFKRGLRRCYSVREDMMEVNGVPDAELDQEEEGIVGVGDGTINIGDGIDIDDNEVQDLPTVHEEIRTFEEIKKEQLAKLEELKQAHHTKESEDKGSIF